LVVPDRYTERFDQLRSYLADEMEAVDDESMQQEVELLGDTVSAGARDAARGE